ncbi:helix-turn-helix transcriptional regulator [Saliphagus sp. GCM10025334]
MVTRDRMVEDINFLTQSPVRVQILEHLREEGELSKRELTERFDVSRVTIQRNVEALKERDWIDNSHPTYAITPLGELVIDEVAPLTDSMEVERKLRPFLKWIPRDSFDLDPYLLATATIIEADPTNPTDWVTYHVDRLKSSTYARGVIQMTGLDAWDAAVEATVHGGAQFELIVTRDVAETLRTRPEYAERVEAILDHDALELYEYDESVPYYLGLLDQYVQFGVTDDRGMPRALVETDSEAVHEWAEDEFEAYRAQAESLEF